MPAKGCWVISKWTLGPTAKTTDRNYLSLCQEPPIHEGLWKSPPSGTCPCPPPSKCTQKNYRVPCWREPMGVQYLCWEVISSPPPGRGVSYMWSLPHPKATVADASGKWPVETGNEEMGTWVSNWITCWSTLRRSHLIPSEQGKVGWEMVEPREG